MKWGVHYPRSGFHECPFGADQASMIEYLAIANGVAARRVVLVHARDLKIGDRHAALGTFEGSAPSTYHPGDVIIFWRGVDAVEYERVNSWKEIEVIR